jgi:hypothetical protein
MVRGPMVNDGSGTEAMNTCALAGAGTTTRRRRARSVKRCARVTGR